VEHLSPFRVGPPSGTKRGKKSWVVEICDQKTKQSLVVESDEPLAGYTIDVAKAGWKEHERHPDGALVGEVDGDAWVCFVELKGTLRTREQKQPPADHALDQLEGGVRHFHPLNRGTTAASHGAEHHDRWVDGSDPLDVRPTIDHHTVGIAVAFRQVPRSPPQRSPQVDSVEVPLRVTQIAMSKPNRATCSFKKLLENAGLSPR
jgi:hypothetical protein